jgi:hypothetical protein
MRFGGLGDWFWVEVWALHGDGARLGSSVFLSSVGSEGAEVAMVCVQLDGSSIGAVLYGCILSFLIKVIV